MTVPGIGETSPAANDQKLDSRSEADAPVMAMLFFVVAFVWSIQARCGP